MVQDDPGAIDRFGLVVRRPAQGVLLAGGKVCECSVGRGKDGIRFIAIEDLACSCCLEEIDEDRETTVSGCLLEGNGPLSCLEEFKNGPFACGRLEELPYLADLASVGLPG